MTSLTDNHLYRATAPLLSEDPTEQQAKVEPPHKFWRAAWHSKYIWTFDPNLDDGLGYHNPEPIFPKPEIMVAGPICLSYELAETLAWKYYNHPGKVFNLSVIGIEPIKVNENGEPL